MASKIALVTGASRGLGKDSALQLAKNGFDIILTFQTKRDSANEVVEEIEGIGQKAFALALDISTTAGFDQSISRSTGVIFAATTTSPL